MGGWKSRERADGGVVYGAISGDNTPTPCSRSSKARTTFSSRV